MGNINFFDLHCDTLTNSFDWKGEAVDTLNDDENIISLNHIPKNSNYAQLFAIFVPDNLRGAEAVDYFFVNANNFKRQTEKFSDKLQACKNSDDINSAFAQNKMAGILSIEGGAAFGGDLRNIEIARDLGVCACTLTWNGENEIASGNVTSKGLSDFGKKAIRCMEENSIVVDVSHLNDVGFYDVLRVAKKPFIATHSNSRKISPHLRNLTDEQIKEIINMGGLVGLNFYIEFLNKEKEKASLMDLFHHAEHILELGGEDVLCMGSDFDGCTVFEDLDSMEKALNLGEFFVNHGIPMEITNKILFDNAFNFFKENIK